MAVSNYPGVRVREVDTANGDYTVVDTGDGQDTVYVYDNADTFFFVKKNGNDGPAHIALKGIAQTGGDANDGKVDLHDGSGTASDDFMALISAAAKGQDNLSLRFNSANSIDIIIDNPKGDDFLVMTGDYVRDALERGATGFDLYNNRDQIKFFCFDNDSKPNEYIYTGRTDNLDQSPDAIGAILKGSFLNEGDELDALVAAALDEKYGLGDTKGLAFLSEDANGLTVQVTNTHWKGPGTDTMILCGSGVDDAIAAYKSGFAGGFNMKNNTSQTAFLDYSDGFRFFMNNEDNTTPVGGGNYTVRRAVGSEFDKHEVDDLLNDFAAGSIDKGTVEILDDGKAGTSTVKITAQGWAPTVDTIFIDNVSDSIIPDSLFA